MSLKYWALVGGLVACVNSVSVLAAPWLEPGDARARFAAQKLADHGRMARGVTTWPMMWSAVASMSGTGSSSGQASNALAAAYLRFEMEEQASPGFRGEFTVTAQSEIPGITGYEANALAKAGTNVNLQWQGKAWALGLKPTYAHSPDDDEEFRVDGSYLAGTLGNWVFGAGAIDRWWGPGWQSSLILSNNARPIPSVWVNRKDTHAPDGTWLNWIGTWDFKLLAGQYESERAVPDAKLIGMRFTFRPVDGLDIGLSRAITFGGEGRENDPGNEITSVDARYGFAVGQQSMGLYAQLMREDESGAFPARKPWLLGADWTTGLLIGEQQWFMEYINTQAGAFLDTAMPNIASDHSRYYGRNMTTSFDDAEALTLGAYHFMASGNNLSAKLSYVEFHREGGNRVIIPNDKVFYTIADEAQKLAIVDLGYGTQLLTGWLDLSLQATDKKIKYVSGEKDQWSLGASWTYRF